MSFIASFPVSTPSKQNAAAAFFLKLITCRRSFEKCLSMDESPATPPTTAILYRSSGVLDDFNIGFSSLLIDKIITPKDAPTTTKATAAFFLYFHRCFHLITLVILVLIMNDMEPSIPQPNASSRAMKSPILAAFIPPLATELNSALK